MPSPSVKFRIESSRRNSICLFNDRRSFCASSTSFSLRLAGIRIRRRARGSAMLLNAPPQRQLWT